MSRFEMISKVSMNDFDKCEYYNQAKTTKTLHKFAIKKSKPLYIIH